MLNSFEQEREMTHEQLQQIRAIVYDAYCEGDTEAEAMLVVIDATRAAPEQDPVAWQERQIIGWKDDTYKWSDWYSCKYNTEQVVKARARTTQYEWRPLYTAPVAAPQREWVGLTVEERRELLTRHRDTAYLAIKVEAALKEKNHG